MTPEKFHHASLDWHPHTPGDPMPCPPDTLVRVLCRDGTQWLDPITAFDLYWGDDNHKKDVIGWHPIEEQQSLARRVLDLLESGDIEQAKHELRKELE